MQHESMQSDQQPSLSLFRQFFFPGIVGVIGIVVSVAMFFTVQTYERQRIHHAFERQARTVAIAVQRSVDECLDALRSIERLYASTGRVERKEFRVFVNGVIGRHPGLLAFEWMPRVSQTQRGRYEGKTQAEGFPGFSIQELNARGQLVAAGRRKEYFPIHYVEPVIGNQKVLGFDHASKASRRAIMAMARDMGVPVATERIQLFRLAATGEKADVLVFLPVYQADSVTETLAQRRRHLSGFVSAVFRLSRIIHTDLVTLGLTKEIKAALDGVPVASRSLSQALPQKSEPPSPKSPAAEIQVRVQWRTSLEVAGQSWSLLFTPTPLWLSASTSWRPLQTLFLGLGASLLLAVYLSSLSRQATRSERLVAERTATLARVNRDLVSEIDGHKRTEEALRESEERARLIVDTAYEAFVAVDATGVIIDWNRQAEALFGWSGREIVGLALTETILPPRYHEAYSTKLKRFLATGGRPAPNNHLVEIPVLNRDGHQRLVEVTITPLRRGRSYIFNAFIRDVTERRREEESLAQLAAIVESSEDAIISETLDGIIVTWNAGAEKIYGYDNEEAVGRPVSMLFPADRLDDGSQISERIKRGESVDHYETVRIRKDGRCIEVSLTISPLKDGTGKVIGASSIARDITLQRAVERMKQEFVSIVSHELRTPLTSIRGSLGLLVGGGLGPLAEKAQRMLEIALSNTDRLVRLINDILDLERLESGKITLQRQVCEAVTLMKQAAEIMQPLAEKAGITLRVVPNAVRFLADPDHILQLLTNLLSNAIKFSPVGSMVWMRARCQGKEAILSVKDQGRGIPTDKIEHIFGRFQQVDASDSRTRGGTGLGLAICRSIVQQHDGHIWVESESGSGSVFFFSLPALPDAATEAASGLHGIPSGALEDADPMAQSEAQRRQPLLQGEEQV